MQILGIAGSLRSGSYNRQLLRLAAENLPDGVELAVWVGLRGLALIRASHGSFGGLWAHAETRKVLGLMGARVVEAELSLGKAPDRLAEPDEDLLGQLRTVIDLLVTEAADRVAAAA